MVEIAKLISQLTRMHVALWIENETLRFEAPADVLDTREFAELKQRKSEAIDHLRCKMFRASPLADDDDTPEIRPLSAAQTVWWELFEQGHIDGLVTFWLVVPPRAPDRYRCALTQIVSRHEVLRTVYKANADRPRQIVLPDLDVEFEVTDLSSRHVADLPAAIAYSAASSPPKINIETGPLVSCRVYRTSIGCDVAQVSFHQICVDVYSQTILASELRFFSGENKEEPPKPLQIQYRHFAAQKHSIEGVSDAWRQRLRETFPVALGMRAACGTRLRRGVTEFALPRPYALALNDVAAVSKVSRNTVAFALASVFALAWSRQTSGSVALLDAGRPAGAEQLIGPFSVVRPMRLDFANETKFHRFLCEVESEISSAAASAYSVTSADICADWFPRVIINVSSTRADLNRAGKQFILPPSERPLHFFQQAVTSIVLGPTQIFVRLDYDLGAVDEKRIQSFEGFLTKAIERIRATPDLSLAELINPSEWTRADDRSRL